MCTGSTACLCVGGVVVFHKWLLLTYSRSVRAFDAFNPTYNPRGGTFGVRAVPVGPV